MTTLARARRETFIALVFGWFLVVTWARFEFALGATVLWLLAWLFDEEGGRG